MIRIVIVDDDTFFLEKIKELLAPIMTSANLKYAVDTFSSGEAMLESKMIYDLLLLDIDMPSISGFDIVKYINDREKEYDYKAVIYISNYENLVFESFKYSPLRFVRKNMLETDFTEAIQAFLTKYTNENEFFIFTDKETNIDIKVNLMDIAYFESYGHDISLFDRYGTKYCIKRNSNITLNSLDEAYSSKGFIRSHKSYLVNYRHIYKIQENKIYFGDWGIALITLRNVREFKLKYQSYVMKE